MTCIWTDIYPTSLCQYCFALAHTYDGTTEPRHGAIAKFESNLKAATDDLYYYKSSCSLLLLFDCAEHDTKTWQPLRELCSSTEKLKDHLWLWNVFFQHLCYREILLMPWKMLVEKILYDALELAYQTDSLQITAFCEVTWKIATWNNQ